MAGEHWYDINAKAVFEVPRAKGGGMRSTTIADAKKLKLFPSCTAVLGILDKPELSNWKNKQITEYAYAYPPKDGEMLEAYHARVMDGAFQQVDDAADLGTRIHKAIELALCGQDYERELTTYVEAVLKWKAENQVAIVESELRLSAPEYGFAGTTDGVIACPRGRGIIDFKSRKTNPQYPCTPFMGQMEQIAAYHVAKFKQVPTEGDCGVNVFISTTEPGRVEACWYDHHQLRAGWEAFNHCLALYRHIKQWDPRHDHSN